MLPICRREDLIHKDHHIWPCLSCETLQFWHLKIRAELGGRLGECDSARDSTTVGSDGKPSLPLYLSLMRTICVVATRTWFDPFCCNKVVSILGINMKGDYIFGKACSYCYFIDVQIRYIQKHVPGGNMVCVSIYWKTADNLFRFRAGAHYLSLPRKMESPWNSTPCLSGTLLCFPGK